MVIVNRLEIARGAGRFAPRAGAIRGSRRIHPCHAEREHRQMPGSEHVEKRPHRILGEQHASPDIQQRQERQREEADEPSQHRRDSRRTRRPVAALPCGEAYDGSASLDEAPGVPDPPERRAFSLPLPDIGYRMRPVRVPKAKNARSRVVEGCTMSRCLRDRSGVCSVFALSLLLAGGLAWAQATAELAGRVTDESWRGAPWRHRDRHADRYGIHAHGRHRRHRRLGHAERADRSLSARSLAAGIPHLRADRHRAAGRRHADDQRRARCRAASRKRCRSRPPRRSWTCGAPASAKWSNRSGSSSCRSRDARSPT